MECKLIRSLPKNMITPYALVVGKVVHLEVRDDIYNVEDGSWMWIRPSP